MSLIFTTKAGTLAALQGVLKSGRIAPMHVFTVAEWQANPSVCVVDIADSLGPGPWIVRSSCGREDSGVL